MYHVWMFFPYRHWWLCGCTMSECSFLTDTDDCADIPYLNVLSLQTLIIVWIYHIWMFFPYKHRWLYGYTMSECSFLTGIDGCVDIPCLNVLSLQALMIVQIYHVWMFSLQTLMIVQIYHIWMFFPYKHWWLCRYTMSEYSLITDIDDCADIPCLNGGTCNDLVNHYDCTCLSDFSGDHCETGNYLVNCLYIHINDSNILFVDLNTFNSRQNMKQDWEGQNAMFSPWLSLRVIKCVVD